LREEGGAGRCKEKGATAIATCLAYDQLPELPGAKMKFEICGHSRNSQTIPKAKTSSVKFVKPSNGM
jgi:hypothetical protein